MLSRYLRCVLCDAKLTVRIRFYFKTILINRSSIVDESTGFHPFCAGAFVAVRQPRQCHFYHTQYSIVLVLRYYTHILNHPTHDHSLFSPGHFRCTSYSCFTQYLVSLPSITRSAPEHVVLTFRVSNTRNTLSFLLRTVVKVPRFSDG